MARRGIKTGIIILKLLCMRREGEKERERKEKGH
jgi:hypothetical protein